MLSLLLLSKSVVHYANNKIRVVISTVYVPHAEQITIVNAITHVNKAKFYIFSDDFHTKSLKPIDKSVWNFRPYVKRGWGSTLRKYIDLKIINVKMSSLHGNTVLADVDVEICMPSQI